MDFYALQLTPRKKKEDDDRRERLNKIKEHVVTREELMAELKHEKVPFESDGEAASSRNRILSPNFSSEKTFSIAKEKEDAEIKSNTIEENIVPPITTLKSPFSEEESAKDFVKSEEIAPIENKKTETKKRIEKIAVIEALKDQSLRKEKIEEQILKDFTEAVTADEENRIKQCIERLIEYRSEDLARINDHNVLNEKLRKNLLETIPVLLAYKSGKSILGLFQLLDEIAISFSAEDLSNLPSEVLRSTELKKTAEKYLLWFAKGYSDSPGELEKRINCFADCKVLSYEEIKGFASLKMAISTNLVDFVKANVNYPLEIERKIYEYALTGLVDEKGVRGMDKVKQIIIQFIFGLIKSKTEEPLLTSKKIKNYEKAGLINSHDIIDDERVEHFIEKFLVKYAKDNAAHPRKVKSMAKEYYDAGLITKELRNKF